jgi:hypothetical protein
MYHLTPCKVVEAEVFSGCRIASATIKGPISYMIARIPENVSTWLADGSIVTIMGDLPPRGRSYRAGRTALRDSSAARQRVDHRDQRRPAAALCRPTRGRS